MGDGTRCSRIGEWCRLTVDGDEDGDARYMGGEGEDGDVDGDGVMDNLMMDLGGIEEGLGMDVRVGGVLLRLIVLGADADVMLGGIVMKPGIWVVIGEVGTAAAGGGEGNVGAATCGDEGNAAASSSSSSSSSISMSLTTMKFRFFAGFGVGVDFGTSGTIGLELEAPYPPIFPMPRP